MQVNGQVQQNVENWKRASGLGMFVMFPDEFLLDEIFSWLEPQTLLTASLVSHVFYIFCQEEELVRISYFPGFFDLGSSGNPFVSENLSKIRWDTFDFLVVGRELSC